MTQPNGWTPEEAERLHQYGYPERIGKERAAGCEVCSYVEGHDPWCGSPLWEEAACPCGEEHYE